MEQDDNKIVDSVGRKLPPAAGMGRAKGSLNKTTKAAKEAIAYAAEQLGGADRMVEWVQSDPANEKIFWGTIYPKLLPLQLTGENGGAIKIDHIERIIVDKDGSTN